MLVLEYKLVGKPPQYAAMDDALRTANFIRNKCIRLWMDHPDAKLGKFDLTAYCVPLSKEFHFAGKLNSQARQASSERAWSSISRYFKDCKLKSSGQLGKVKSYPKFKKVGRSVEYKATGWKLSEDRRFITFTDGFGIGRLKLLDKRPLNHYDLKSIKRVRILKRADGYYCQFVLDLERSDLQPETGKMVGVDVGLESFYTDSNGVKVPCLKSLRKSESKLKRLQRRLSRKKLKSNNRRKAKARLAKAHLKVSRQRKDYAAKAAGAIMVSNDVVAIEDLQVRNMVKNRRLSKSIHDASWTQFRGWLEYYAKVYGRVLITVPPHHTSQDCSGCGIRVPKDLSVRTHSCSCGCILDRDHNAAINILNRGLEILKHGTVGHTGTKASA